MKKSIAISPCLQAVSSALLMPCLGLSLLQDMIPLAQRKEAKSWWAETMDIPEAKWIVWTSIVVILIIIAFYVAKLFRDMAFGRSESGDLMTDFGRLRDQGALDDEEYAQLKQAMAKQQMKKAGIERDPAIPIKTSSKPKTLAEMKKLEEERKAAQSNNPTNPEEPSQEQ